MKTITNLLFFSLLLASCGVAHKSSTITPEEGYIIYRQSAPEASLTLLGDYAFHPLQKKYFTDVDKSALKYLAHRLHGQRPQLMFASHTFVQPYYAAVGMQYNHVAVDTALYRAVKEDLKQSLHAAFTELPAVSTDYGAVQGITYRVMNPLTKRFTSHAEYFIPYQDGLLRLFFWTSDRDERAFVQDAEGILKKLEWETATGKSVSQ